MATIEQVNLVIDRMISKSQSVAAGAGHPGENVLKRLMDYKGCLPPPSGLDKSNDVMINAIRDVQDDDPQIESSYKLFNNLPDIQQHVCLNDRYFLGMPDDLGNKYTITSISISLGLNPNTYKKIRQSAHDQLKGNIDGAMTANPAKYAWLNNYGRE